LYQGGSRFYEGVPMKTLLLFLVVLEIMEL